jgi:hypothetical protein
LDSFESSVLLFKNAINENLFTEDCHCTIYGRSFAQSGGRSPDPTRICHKALPSDPGHFSGPGSFHGHFQAFSPEYDLNRQNTCDLVLNVCHHYRYEMSLTH